MKTVQIDEDELKDILSVFNLRDRNREELSESKKEYDNHIKRNTPNSFLGCIRESLNPELRGKYSRYRKAENIMDINTRITMSSIIDNIGDFLRDIEKQI